jgi:malonate-semialdehyde dehydrogenase (acetylating) / methylmalonate-semialdehyde dehydrogenase
MTATAAQQAAAAALGHWLDGAEVAGTSGRSGEVFNPSTGQVTAQVAFASLEELDRCVASAKAASVAWAATPPLRRARVLFRYRQLLEAASEELAQTISREHGKTVADARGEIVRGLEVVEFACGIPDLIKGEYNENVGTGVDAWSIRQPLGVVAGITPFNFPAMVPLWMFPVALACGNSFILKPSERDPSA